MIVIGLTSKDFYRTARSNAFAFFKGIGFNSGVDSLSFQPLYFKRPWGGDALRRLLGRDVPNGPIGESWEIVDRTDAQSVVSEGGFAGQTLDAIMKTHYQAIMGPDWPKEKRFPLIFKWLDCSERLSLQVHPPQKIAEALNGEPKTEFWYVFDAQDNAGVFLGLKSGANRMLFENALLNNELEPILHRLPTIAGRGIFVPSGRLHAIDAGNVILEIQQNSDTTYRVYDWGRLGLDGHPRSLHIQESLACIDFSDIEPSGIEMPARDGEWVACPYFKIENVLLKKGDLNLKWPQGPYVISVVRGLIQLKKSARVLGLGEHLLVPYAGVFEAECLADAHLIVTSQFNSI